MIYASDEVSFSWDGQQRGEPVSPGVYVYKIDIEYRIGGMTYTEQIVGDITVIR